MSFHCPPSRAPSPAHGDLSPPTVGEALTATTTTVTIIMLSHLACVSCPCSVLLTLGASTILIF